MLTRNAFLRINSRFASSSRLRSRTGLRWSSSSSTSANNNSNSNNHNNHNNNNNIVVLGVESTCDDSAVAAVSSTGTVLFNLVSSQWDLHVQHGGVMPTMAARAHERNLPLLIQDATRRLSALNITPAYIAVSSGPGLAPCLLQGIKTAIDAATQFKVPLIGVNHLEAHLLSPRLTEVCKFPHLALLVSGGHCMLVVVRGVGEYKVLGTTLDDSVGEAFDKVARTVGCDASDGRHPGAQLEAIAATGTAANVPFRPSMVRVVDCNFSFSGLKTQVVRAVATIPEGESSTTTGRLILDNPSRAADIAASFQATVIDHLEVRTRRAIVWLTIGTSVYRGKHLFNKQARRKWKTEALRKPLDFEGLTDDEAERLSAIVLCGGVAANEGVRLALTEIAAEAGLPLVVPPPTYCTDNGAMVAWVALERIRCGASLEHEPVARARWPLTDVGV